jgi:hypothetical protein
VNYQHIGACFYLVSSAVDVVVTKKKTSTPK